jgi:hypothetical protein
MGCLPDCTAATKPKARSPPKGFSFAGTRTPHDSKSLHGLRGREHTAPNTPGSPYPACQRGTGVVMGTKGGTRPMMNESLPQGWLGRTKNRALERGMVLLPPLGELCAKNF